MTPHQGNAILFRSSQQLPRLRLSPRLASCVASGTTGVQGHHQVCRARRGGPRTPSTTTDANLDCELLKTHFFTPILDCEKSVEYNWVRDQTWSLQAEREQRYNLRKDLEQRMNSESMIQLGNLAQSIRDNDGDETEKAVGGNSGSTGFLHLRNFECYLTCSLDKS